MPKTNRKQILKVNIFVSMSAKPLGFFPPVLTSVEMGCQLSFTNTVLRRFKLQLAGKTKVIFNKVVFGAFHERSLCFPVARSKQSIFTWMQHFTGFLLNMAEQDYKSILHSWNWGTWCSVLSLHNKTRVCTLPLQVFGVVFQCLCASLSAWWVVGLPLCG